MDKCSGAKNAKAGDIGLVPTPGLFGSQVIESPGRGNIVDKGGVFEGVIPVCLRKIRIKEHGLDLIKKSPVHALSNTIMLWCVGCGKFLFNAFAVEVLGGNSSCVFAPSI